MSSAISRLNCGSIIKDRVEARFTHAAIALELQQQFPGVSGLSERSVKRYCSANNIHYSSCLNQERVDQLVEQAVFQVGPSYGRRTLSGLLRSQGIVVGEQRVRTAMSNVTPAYIEHRQQHTYRSMNPIPYYAQYHGHKLHLDQNEKLIRFGVTHVAASDGYSGKLLGIISMPVKNPITIYDELYRPIVTEYGLWDQLRVDCGKEFALILYVQDALSSLRTNTQRLPYVQTQSKQNHIAERHWVEVNTRVNYPLKAALTWMQTNQIIDLDCPITQYCVSLMTGILAQVGIQLHLQSWNNHRIPGPNRGIPNNLAEQNDHTSRISSTQIPSTDDAVSSFIASGGSLSSRKLFGIDPLSGSSSLIHQRQLELEEKIPCPQEIFAHTVNGDYSYFTHSLEFLIDSTTRLQRQI